MKKLKINKKALLLAAIVTVLLAAIGFAAFYQPAQKESGKMAGINTKVPGASFDQHEKPIDKMSFYDQAKLDSAKENSDNHNPLLQQLNPKYEDPTVTQINQKLAAINQQVAQPQPSVVTPPANHKAMTEQVNRLEGLMKGLKNDGPDPEMQQISKMLGQLQSIQHPELVGTKQDSTSSPFQAIAAQIDGKQKIKQSGAVRLKLTDTLVIKGQHIPKGTLVFGTATITSQRLLVAIKNIRLGQSIIPVDLVVYAMDGMPGVPAPEAEYNEAAADGATSALQNMQFMTMDQSLGAQAAAGGINAAKSLFGKKVKRITVHLKDGQQVLLRDNQIR